MECVYSVGSDSLPPHRLQPVRLLCPMEFSRQLYWGGLPFPTHGIFLTQGSNSMADSKLGLYFLQEFWTPRCPERFLVTVDLGVYTPSPAVTSDPPEGAKPLLSSWIWVHVWYTWKRTQEHTARSRLSLAVSREQGRVGGGGGTRGEWNGPGWMKDRKWL